LQKFIPKKYKSDSNLPHFRRPSKPCGCRTQRHFRPRELFLYYQDKKKHNRFTR